MRLLKNLWHDPLGFGGMIVILLAFVCALFAYIIIPDNSPNANSMNLAISNKKPGFTMLEIRRVLDNTKSKSNFFEKMLSGESPNYERLAVSSARRKGDTVFYREYPLEEGAEKIIELSELYEFKEGVFWKELKFPLGTDRFGRDLLSRLILGTRVSFSVGFVAVLISLLIGIPLGGIAGYYGGWVDKVVMWFINVLWSIPGLLLVIAITLALGKGFWQVFVAIGFTMWVEVARVIRGQILSVKEKEYVQAARVLGYKDVRILFHHILPNVFAPLIVISAANFAAAILIESGLSFLGIGAQPPVPSWGGMIKDHYAYLLVDKAYLAIIPGMAIMLLVLAFMMLGNALRDVLDVRQV